MQKPVSLTVVRKKGPTTKRVILHGRSNLESSPIRLPFVGDLNHASSAFRAQLTTTVLHLFIPEHILAMEIGDWPFLTVYELSTANAAT